MLYLKYLKYDTNSERQAPIPINKIKISFTDITIEKSSNNCYKKNQFTFKLDGLFFEHEKESSIKKGVKCITLSEKRIIPLRIITHYSWNNNKTHIHKHYRQ